MFSEGVTIPHVMRGQLIRSSRAVGKMSLDAVVTQVNAPILQNETITPLESAYYIKLKYSKLLLSVPLYLLCITLVSLFFY